MNMFKPATKKTKKPLEATFEAWVEYGGIWSSTSKFKDKYMSYPYHMSCNSGKCESTYSDVNMLVFILKTI